MTATAPLSVGQTLTGPLFNEPMCVEAVAPAGAESWVVGFERRVAEDRRDCYWVYVVTHCNTTPRLRELIKDPARLQWNEVVKVAHYRIDTQGLPGGGA